jgi:hypothetical protein
MTSGIAKIRNQVKVFGRFQTIVAKVSLKFLGACQAPGCR